MVCIIGQIPYIGIHQVYIVKFTIFRIIDQSCIEFHIAQLSGSRADPEADMADEVHAGIALIPYGGIHIAAVFPDNHAGESSAGQGIEFLTCGTLKDIQELLVHTQDPFLSGNFIDEETAWNILKDSLFQPFVSFHVFLHQYAPVILAQLPPEAFASYSSFSHRSTRSETLSSTRTAALPTEAVTCI